MKHNKKNLLWIISSGHIYRILEPIIHKLDPDHNNHLIAINRTINNEVTTYLDSISVKYYELSDFSLLDIASVFKKIDPQMLITGIDNLAYERTLIALAKKRRIKTMLIQEGNFHLYKEPQKAEDSTYYFTLKTIASTYLRCAYSLLVHGLYDDLICFYKERKNKNLSYSMYGTQHCDFILLMGEYYHDLLKKKGVSNSSKIVITGHPMIDLIYTVKSKGVVNKKKKKNSILYIDGPLVEDRRWSRAEKISYINKMKQFLPQDYELVIQRHPRSLLSNFPKNCTFSKQSLHEAITLSQATITFESTAAFDSLLLGVPNIVLKNLLFNDNFLSENALSYCLEKFEDLRHIDSIIREQSTSMKTNAFKKRLEYVIYKFDNRSSQRISEYIRKVLK